MSQFTVTDQTRTNNVMQVIEVTNERVNEVLPSPEFKNMFACIVCGTTFPEVTQVLQHIMQAHRGGLLCLKCKHLLPSNQEMKLHEISCNTERPFFLELAKCSICSSLYEQTSSTTNMCLNCTPQCSSGLSAVHKKELCSNNIICSGSAVVNHDSQYLNDEFDIQSEMKDEYIDINSLLSITFSKDETAVKLQEVSDKHSNIVENLTEGAPNEVQDSSCASDNLLQNYMRDTVIIKHDNNFPCNIHDCQCLEYQTEKFPIPVCKLLCDLKQKLLQREKVFESNVEINYFIHCTTCQHDFRINDYYKTHILQYNELDPCNCAFCDEDTNSKNHYHFLRHFQKHLIKTEKSNFQKCPRCTASFFSIYNQKRHEENEHLSSHASLCVKNCNCEVAAEAEKLKKFCKKKISLRNIFLFRIYCSTCDIDVAQFNYFENHLHFRKDKYTSCPFCSENSRSKKLFFSHLWQHFISGFYEQICVCTVCESSFLTAYNLGMHSSNLHPMGQGSSVNVIKSYKNRHTRLQIQVQDLPNAITPDNLLSNFKNTLAECKRKYLNYKNRTFKIHCISCGEDILCTDFLQYHIWLCFKSFEAKCPFCGRETQEEKCDVLNHFVHVWNEHLSKKIKPSSCRKCEVAFLGDLNNVLHCATVHCTKNNFQPFEFCAIKSSPPNCEIVDIADSDDSEQPPKVQKLDFT